MLFGSMGTKMWRTRVRSLLSNFILFGLGVMTCLILLQYSSSRNSLIDSSNPQEFQQLQQTQSHQVQQENPCDSNINNNNKNKIVSSNNHNTKLRTTPSLYYEEVSEHLTHSKPYGSFERDGDGENERSTASKTYYNSKNERSTASKTYNNIKSSAARIQRQGSVTIQSTKPLTNRNSSSSNINNNHKESLPGPTVWVVTPTYYRPEQKPELTRVAQALLPVSNFIHWLVIDDVSQGTEASIRDLKVFLQRFSLTFTLLKSFPPTIHTKIVGKPRGVGGRRAAIDWLRKHAQEGIVYFADDDNTYDSDIFRQMQQTKKISMFPVGLVTELGVSSPIVKNGRVVGFYDGWNGLRKFPVDMAAFAINVKLFHAAYIFKLLERNWPEQEAERLLYLCYGEKGNGFSYGATLTFDKEYQYSKYDGKPKGNMPFVAGYEEDELLKTLDVSMQDIEPLANNCTEILVWHTKAVKNVWPKRPKNLKASVAANTNLSKLLKSLPQKSLAGPASGQNKSEGGFSLLHFIFGGL